MQGWHEKCHSKWLFSDNNFFLVKRVQYHLHLENKNLGFPGGAVVENLPANAGDTGSRPGLGRSHMPQSNWAREPQLLSLRVWSLCSTTREARAPRWRVAPRLLQLEKALAQKQRPNTAKKRKNQSINKKLKRGIFIKK